ncbi:MAG: hypothetical protein HYT65_02465 [Candidatus Yanofskybacteria bacterium]|nr:hypothetical protein [Candidatus Yanofskybacteria bacterium]
MATAPKNQSTKDFVEIADIRDNVAILKDGSLRSVLEVGSMNFALKSADEQTAIISAFQNFLNSIDFPLQIAINSRKLDIGPYMESLGELTQSISNELMKIQAVEYTRFIKGLTELANIMSKKFYIVIPLYLVETIGKGDQKTSIFGAFKSVVAPSKIAKTLTDQEFENYKTQLGQKSQFVMDSISGLGIETRILGKEELRNLYYSYYNPGHHL